MNTRSEFHEKVVLFLEKMREEKRLVKGAYYSDEDDQDKPCFCMVGAIGEFTRQLANSSKEEWKEKNLYDDHQVIASIYPIDVNSLYAMDVIFEKYETLSASDFRDLSLLVRNIDWNIPAIYKSMLHSVYSYLYVEAGLAVHGFHKIPKLSWESWPEIRSELSKNLKKRFAHEFDFFMIDLLLNPKDMEFQKVLSYYIQGEYSDPAQLIQKLKSHTSWDTNGGGTACRQ